MQTFRRKKSKINNLRHYQKIKDELKLLVIPWKLGEDAGKVTKKESYSNEHFKALKNIEGYSAGNPFLHDLMYYKILDPEQWGVRLANQIYLNEWCDEYILLAGDCDFVIGNIPEEEKKRAREVTAGMIPEGYKALQRKEGIPDQVHTFCWVHKDILKHLTGSQFKIPLGEARKTPEGKLKKSVFELFFAGKFLRCGKDYQGELDFYNLPKMSAEKFLSLVDYWESWGMNRKNIHRDLKKAKEERAYIEEIEGSDKEQVGSYEDAGHLRYIRENIFHGKVSGYNQGRAFLQYVKAYDSITGKNSYPILMPVLERITSSPDGLLRGYMSTKFSKKHLKAVKGYGKTQEVNSTKKQVFILKPPMKYISDNEDLLNSIRYHGWKTLLAAPMGTGKSWAILDIYSKSSDSIKILAVPRNTLKSELIEKARARGLKVQIVGGKGNPSFKRLEIDTDTLYICSFEALLYLDDLRGSGKKGSIEIIIDEIHTFVTDKSYRKKLIDVFNVINNNQAVKRLLMMTATPEDLPKLWDTEIRVESPKEFPVKLKFVTASEGRKVVTNKEMKHILDQERKKLGKFIFVTQTGIEMAERMTGLKCYNTKNVEEIQGLLSQGKLPEGDFCITDLISAGNSFNTEEKINIVIKFNSLYSSRVVQVLGRFRNSVEINATVIVPSILDYYNYREAEEHLQRFVEQINSGNFSVLSKHEEVLSTYLSLIDLNARPYTIKEDSFKLHKASKNTFVRRLEHVVKHIKEDHPSWPVEVVQASEVAEFETVKTLKLLLKSKFIKKEEINKGFLYFFEANRQGRSIASFKETYPEVYNFFTLSLADDYSQPLWNLRRNLKNSPLNTEDYFRKYFGLDKVYRKISTSEEEGERVFRGMISIDKPVFVDGQYLTKTRKVIENVLGNVFVYGEREANLKKAKTIIKDSGLNVTREKGTGLHHITIDYKKQYREHIKARKKKDAKANKVIKKALKLKKLADIPSDKVVNTVMEEEDFRKAKVVKRLRGIEESVPLEVKDEVTPTPEKRQLKLS